MVDDEDTVLEVFTEILEQAGFCVLTAADGREAVAVFAAHADEIDAILLDVFMPHMDGQAALREIRLIREDIPVIVTSGLPASEVTAWFPFDSVTAFLQKPFHIEALVNSFRAALGEHARS